MAKTKVKFDLELEIEGDVTLKEIPEIMDNINNALRQAVNSGGGITPEECDGFTVGAVLTHPETNRIKGVEMF
jgi:hypothetical protein